MYHKLITIIFCFGCLSAFSQNKKETENYQADCCKKETKKAVLVKSHVMPDTIKKREVSCKLTSPELRKRKEEVIAVLKAKVRAEQELPDGYKFKFEATDEMLDQLTAFIKSERACCDFFNFNLAINDNIVWLSITGPDGARDFIKNEIEF